MPSLDITNSSGPESPSLPSIPPSLDADYLYSVVTGADHAVTASLNPTYIHLAYGPPRRNPALCGTKIDACA